MKDNGGATDEHVAKARRIAADLKGLRKKHSTMPRPGPSLWDLMEVRGSQGDHGIASTQVGWSKSS